MHLVFLYQPVDDLEAAATFHREELGWEEAWRDGELTVAFWTPGHRAQVMLSTTPQPPGPMYQVEGLRAWIAAHPDIAVPIAPYAIPGGQVAGFEGTGGTTFYVFDQPDAAGA